MNEQPTLLADDAPLPQKRADVPAIWQDFREQLTKLKATAETLTVTDVSQKVEMKLARATRLALREVRVAIEKRRKELGEEALRQKQQIDSGAKELKDAIEPLEARLLEQEEFAERAELKMKEDRANERVALMRPLGIDCSLYNLREMTDEQFTDTMTGIKAAHDAKIAAAEKEEEDRIAKEKADAEERERVRLENERLKKEAEEREAQAKKEREEAAAEKARIEKQLADERKAAEAKAAKIKKEAEEAARLAAEKAKKEREAIEDKARQEAIAAQKAREEAQAKFEAEAKKQREEAAERERIASEKAKAAAEKALKERESIEAEAKEKEDALKARMLADAEARDRAEAKLAAKMAADKKADAARAAISADFETWWHDEGSAMRPNKGEDAEEHTHRVAGIAWQNGAFKSKTS